MVKMLIVTHGGLAEELLAGAETIAGRNPCLAALSLGWDDDLVVSRQKVLAAIEALQPDEGVLILTDMFGGTPFNVAAALAEPGRIEVVAGVNLPMIVRLECLGDQQLGVTELADWIQAKGRDSIRRSAAPAVSEAPCAEAKR